MDEIESNEIRKIIDKNGNDKLDFWKLMRRIKNKKQQTKKIRKQNGEITEDIEDILEEKKKYYKNLYSKPKQNQEEKNDEENKMREIMMAMEEGHDLKINDRITIKEVEDIIDKCATNKAPGPDEITNEMLKNGKDFLKDKLCDIANDLKEKRIEVPINWSLGDISFYKGKGDWLDLEYQRGITLTSAILKMIESIFGKRIEPIIRNNTTPLQGGGKKGESAEEYIFVLQTIIDCNKKDKKTCKLIIADVEKAFDHAWRVGVFHNLVKRGIKGKTLDLLWRLNNNIRIKQDSQLHSDEFNVEESIRQGGYLSAIFYAQHVGSVVEDLEVKELGKRIGRSF